MKPFEDSSFIHLFFLSQNFQPSEHSFIYDGVYFVLTFPYLETVEISDVRIRFVLALKVYLLINLGKVIHNIADSCCNLCWKMFYDTFQEFFEYFIVILRFWIIFYFLPILEQSQFDFFLLVQSLVLSLKDLFVHLVISFQNNMMGKLVLLLL